MIVEPADAVAVLDVRAPAVLVTERARSTVVVPATENRPLVQLGEGRAAVQVRTERPQVQVTGSNQGPRGPQGIQGLPGAGPALEIPFHWGDASPIELGTVTGVVVSASLAIVSAFDGLGAALSITSEFGDVLMAAASNLPSEIGRYEANPGISLSVPTRLLLNITPGLGASCGRGITYLEITNVTLD